MKEQDAKWVGLGYLLGAGVTLGAMHSEEVVRWGMGQIQVGKRALQAKLAGPAIPPTDKDAGVGSREHVAGPMSYHRFAMALSEIPGTWRAVVEIVGDSRWYAMETVDALRRMVQARLRTEGALWQRADEALFQVVGVECRLLRPGHQDLDVVVLVVPYDGPVMTKPLVSVNDGE